jgi:hypothetical protein
MSQEDGRDLSEENLVRVHTASCEIEALSIVAMLEAEGVDCASQSRQMPMYDGIAQVFNPDWGYILVREGDLERARSLIEEFLTEPGGADGDGVEDEQ